MSSYTATTVPTQFAEEKGIRFAYRRWGTQGGLPLVFNQHFTGNLDNWDPAVLDGLARERSKEAFCLEVLERYFDLVGQNIEKTLRNDATAPLERMRAWVDLQIRYLEQAGMRNGCLIGNYGVEASDHCEAVQESRLLDPAAVNVYFDSN